MGKIVNYRGTTGSTGTAAGLASITILNKGTVRGWTIHARATGGAGIGFYTIEVGVNQAGQSNAEVGGASRLSSLGGVTYSTPNAAAGVIQGTFHPAKLDVIPGDTFTLNQTQTGTAAASLVHILELFVEE